MSLGYEIGRPPGRDELRTALSMAPQRLDLAALAIARLHHPTLDPAPALERLDALAAEARARPGDRLEAVLSVLREEDFRGDALTYDDPRNSCLDLVLERRRGLPILLSVVFMEVGWRAGVEFAGLALPGHFMVRHHDTIIDPFGGGRVLSREACEQRVREVVPDATLSDEALRPAPVEAICWRMLNNLRGSYQRRGLQEQVLRVVDLMLELRPRHPVELRFRGELLARMGAFKAALADLEQVLATRPADAAGLQRQIKSLRDRVGLLH